MTDLRLALRLCLRHPLLSLAAIGSLALGIGANTAIFTVLNGSVLQPLPYPDPGKLMVVWETRADNPRRAVAPANFLDWRQAAPAFSGLAAFDDFSATLTGYGEAQRVRAVSTSANFFEVLGAQARLGRVMVADDDRPGAARVAVLTDGLWHRLFGGSHDAIGKSIILNSIPHTIVGVLPPDFSMAMINGPEVWMTGDRGIPRSFPFPGDITAGSRFAHHRGDRPPCAGRHARSGAGAAHERDGGAVETPSRHQRRPRRQRQAAARGNRRRHSTGDSADPDRGGGAAADRVRERRASAPRPGRRPAGGDCDARRDGRRSIPHRQAAAGRDVDHRRARRHRRPVPRDGGRPRPGRRGAGQPAASLGDSDRRRRRLVSRSP